ncbi:unnamed protein product [Porites lobata]|uniref:FRIGIDA-like protein n=1 Tax=Porites lobata TaxID=104759 RepID=A0ABN8RBU8_9CNID|nr:unnamed protein product [Porites lobata]
MGEVKRLRQENLRLKDQIQASSKEVEQMKLWLQQSSIQLAGEPPTTANATPSREGEKSLSFLSDKHDELILFKTNAMAELERLGKKIEAVKEKVKNISEAIESMENYSYQYNINLVGFPELYEHESANDTAKLCLEIFKAIGASELTGQDIDIAHRVQSRSDIGPKPIICKFVRRLAKENVMNHRREKESISSSTLGTVGKLLWSKPRFMITKHQDYSTSYQKQINSRQRINFSIVGRKMAKFFFVRRTNLE